MAQSLETGKRQKVVLLFNLYPSLVFLIRDIVLYRLPTSLRSYILGLLFCKLHTPEAFHVIIFNYKNISHFLSTVRTAHGPETDK